jgi:glycosyltransferase involved in cell wall biosynthesis
VTGKKTRILFVIENASYGGGEKVFSQLIRNLPRSGFEVFCAASGRGRFFEEVQDCCKFIEIDLSNRFSLGAISGLKRIMLENLIEVAHSQGARADFYCAFAAFRAGVKAVSTVAMPVEGFDVCFVRKQVYRFFNALAEKKIGRFITVSGTLERRLAEGHGIAPSKITLVPNPVDAADFDPARFNAGPVIEKFGLRGKIVLGAAGRLEWQKGFDCMLSGLKILLACDASLAESLVCLIAGSGGMERSLRAKAALLGVEKNVVFCGHIREMRDFFGALDIFVMPSLLEGQPLALLEAMAMGKPIVAFDIPGINESAANGVEALLVKPGDPQALAAGIRRLLGDRALAAELGLNARKRSGGFRLDKFVSKHEAVYAAALGEN